MNVYPEFCLLSLASGMRLGHDGRYNRVTVRLSDRIPGTQCQELLSNLKV